LSQTREGVLRIGRKILHPFAQQILVQIEIARGLGHRHAPLAYQLNRLSAPNPGRGGYGVADGDGAVTWLHGRAQSTHRQPFVTRPQL
jgi:hypothetical protein